MTRIITTPGTLTIGDAQQCRWNIQRDAATLLTGVEAALNGLTTRIRATDSKQEYTALVKERRQWYRLREQLRTIAEME